MKQRPCAHILPLISSINCTPKRRVTVFNDMRSQPRPANSNQCEQARQTRNNSHQHNQRGRARLIGTTK